MKHYAILVQITDGSGYLSESETVVMAASPENARAWWVAAWNALGPVVTEHNTFEIISVTQI